ncbi:VOC family protein [Leucobacter luti]|uniref:VOC family protein n=1 Tax=Leucobacter luti TaxID=340320 RepID=UPI003D01F43D
MSGLGFSLEPMPLVGVVVTDLDAAIARYSALFGLEFRIFVPGVDYELRYETSGEGDTSQELPGRLRIAFDTDDSFELVEIPGSAEGVRNMHYRVDDMDAALAHFAAQGLEPVQIIRAGGAREVVFDASDLTGLRLCLLQFDGDSFAEALAASPQI